LLAPDMRRFSQRNSLVTLNEINITPLLDLAFVLLLIFIITRPMLEQSMDLKLPRGGEKSNKVEAKDRLTVEISPQGIYKLNGRPITLASLLDQLKTMTRANPGAFVSIRTDKKAPSEYFYAVMDGCQKRDIVRFELKTSTE
ncbi:MAG: biopolymer transporter ExbD, partial [Verrucomicrobiota bacterium]